MADKILSQDEVDALLKGVVSGEVDTSAKDEPEEAQRYSLLNQERIIRGRMPTLEMIHDRFIKKQASPQPADLRGRFTEAPLRRRIPKGDSVNAEGLSSTGFIRNAQTHSR